MEENKYILLYKWRTGEYWGFAYKIKNRYYIFNNESDNVGWIDHNNRAWNINGEYIGNLTKNHYILKREIYTKPINRIPIIPRNKPNLPQYRGRKKQRERLVGYQDTLENL